MARKTRTPPPPRRVQAPKTRRDERSRRGLVVAAAAAALAIAAGTAVAAVVITRDKGGESVSVAQAMRAAGCTYRTFPAVPAVHINNPDAKPKEWNSFPPTSGPHYGQWVVWGEYDQPLRPAMAVHNLEHGGIVIYYGKDVSQAQIEALRRFWREDPTAMLLSPLPKLGDKIAVTAWYAPNADKPAQRDKGAQGILAECTRFNEDAFTTFRDAYRFKGPERIPPEDLQPGD